MSIYSGDALKDLVSAIRANIEQVNRNPDDETMSREPVVPLQYIDEELEHAEMALKEPKAGSPGPQKYNCDDEEMEEVELVVRVRCSIEACLTEAAQKEYIALRIKDGLDSEEDKSSIVEVLKFKSEAEIYGNK